VEDEYWDKLDQLVTGAQLRVDRPKGSPHPHYPVSLYPLDYGYLEGTRSADGTGIDAWIGSLPSRQVTGIICTVDLQKQDTRIKPLLGCTPGEAQEALASQQHGFQGAILIERPENGNTTSHG